MPYVGGNWRRKGGLIRKNEFNLSLCWSNCSLALAKESFGKTIFELGFDLKYFSVLYCALKILFWVDLKLSGLITIKTYNCNYI